ncbi:DUF2264 domain-containing protein [Tropicimonas sediminicola]|uniref:DUF2264 domain-containing protein n=1 Tax=Tropicimonas sediminicola TaxID=1031541 RepID=A0A239F2V6_9RHOB|nr:DUF2264 domain-containing protein [Tropicimonas sediminicola]SNS51041.1 hypothetical protein SAMN05421757_102460 [Tropicimonas sediminicola]
MNEAYIHFEQTTQKLVRPLVSLMRPGEATLPIAGPASDHDQMADELESFARPCLLISLWLQSTPVPADRDEIGLDREQVAQWMRAALLLGTDPESPKFWGHLRNFHQHGVEMAIITMSLEVAKAQLWEPLSQAEKAQVAAWFGAMRGSARYWNNHLFFGVLTIEFLRNNGFAEPEDGALIEHMFRQLECMHQGGGWFMDGSNQSFDYYNAFAFHTYGMWWSLKYGHNDRARADRWLGWARSFVKDYAHFFAASGQHVAYGRSITYRFNALSVFGLAARHDLGVLPMGEMRRICRKNLEFFMDQPITQAQGCLSMGWTDEFQEMVEPYSCAASPYWASKGLLFMMLPPAHPFWTDEEQPYPAERGDFAHAIETPGFVLRGIGGEVELLNAGSAIAFGSTKRYGSANWGRASYRTGHGFNITYDPAFTPIDAALTVLSSDGKQRYGRNSTFPTHVGTDHLSYMYSYGLREDPFITQIKTTLFWNGNWTFCLNRIAAQSRSVFSFGGHAVASAEATALRSRAHDLFGTAHSADRSVALQGLVGFTGLVFEERLSDATPRVNIRRPYHMVPVLTSDEIAGERLTLAALMWTGTAQQETRPWTLSSAAEGKWVLSQDEHPDWEIAHRDLPSVPGVV